MNRISDRAADYAIKGFMAEHPDAGAMDIYRFVRGELFGLRPNGEDLGTGMNDSTIDLAEQVRGLAEAVRELVALADKREKEEV